MQEFDDTMRPKKTDSTVKIPITFSKRSEGSIDGKSLFIIILVATVLFVFFLIGVLTGGSAWFIKIPVTLFLIYAYIFFFRFFVFREGRVSDNFEDMKANDHKLSTNVFWNIYDVDKEPPYVVYYANGLKGIFVQFNKDVIVGKEDYMEFNHFQGLADMYNVAHNLGLDIVNIDYMDTVGNDERMEAVHAYASNISNPELKAIMTGIYSNLEHEMALDYTSYDVYLFTTRGRKEDLWYNVRQVIEYGLKANYESYTVLTPDHLRKMAQSVMNLENFSMIKAEKEVINSTLQKRIRPISVTRSDGSVEVIGKTMKQIREEQERARKQRIERNNKAKQAKQSNGVSVSKDEDLIDLFEGTSELDKQWSEVTETNQKKSKAQVKEAKKKNKTEIEIDDDDIF